MISIDRSNMQTDTVDLANLPAQDTALEIRNLDLRYGEKQALFNVSMKIPKKQVTAFIGPSGCGKSTLLRCINRMNDLVDTCKIDGEILLHGQNIYDKKDFNQSDRRVACPGCDFNDKYNGIYEFFPTVWSCS